MTQDSQPKAESVAKADPTEKPKRVKKEKEYTGSRWLGLVLLIVTALVSLMLYLRGQQLAGNIGEPNISLPTSQSTYRFEK